MPDENLGGKFVYIVGVLGIFIILVSTMPAQFYSTAPEYEEYSYPSYFSKEDIEYIAFMRNETIDLGEIYYTTILDFTDDPETDKGERGKINYKITVEWYDTGWPITSQTINFQHIEWEWWVFRRRHIMYCFNPPDKKASLRKTDLTENWDTIYNASIIYPVACTHLSTKVWFTDTNSSRNDIADAFDEGSLNVIMGFGFDNYTTTISSWTLVGQLLTFQAPNIHWTLNAIIAIPLWSMIAYLAYILILKAIPFVG